MIIPSHQQCRAVLDEMAGFMRELDSFERSFVKTNSGRLDFSDAQKQVVAGFLKRYDISLTVCDTSPATSPRAQRLTGRVARPQLQAGPGFCRSCGKPIPRERLEAVPDATQCASCLSQNGDTPRVRGTMVYDQKTGGRCEVVSSTQFETMRSLPDVIDGRVSRL